MAGLIKSRDAAVSCAASVQRVAGRLIVRLPQDASAALPSRGQVAVAGRCDGAPFQAVLEPDGMRGHWLALDAAPQLPAMVEGARVELEFDIAEQWPEPAVPADLQDALDAAPDLEEMWHDITPMARWEWVRWVGATKSPATRARRVEVTVSKMRAGKRRPCCFDLSSCTDPELAKNGKLLGLT